MTVSPFPASFRLPQLPAPSHRLPCPSHDRLLEVLRLTLAPNRAPLASPPCDATSSLSLCSCAPIIIASLAFSWNALPCQWVICAGLIDRCLHSPEWQMDSAPHPHRPYPLAHEAQERGGAQGSSHLQPPSPQPSTAHQLWQRYFADSRDAVVTEAMGGSDSLLVL